MTPNWLYKMKWYKTRRTYQLVVHNGIRDAVYGHFHAVSADHAKAVVEDYLRRRDYILWIPDEDTVGLFRRVEVHVFRLQVALMPVSGDTDEEVQSDEEEGLEEAV